MVSSEIVNVKNGAIFQYAVSLMALFMVTVTGLPKPLYDPSPVPVHPCHTYPSPSAIAGAVASMETIEPTSYHPLSGVTVPKFVDIVRRNCLTKTASATLGASISNVVDVAVASTIPGPFQLWNRYLVETPSPPVGVSTDIAAWVPSSYHPSPVGSSRPVGSVLTVR